MESRRPLIVDVRSDALDDGPGIRTTVFFKGCPLECVWCHNPEGISPDPELAHHQRECLRCGACTQACGPGAIGASPMERLDRAACDLCLDCTGVCPSGALEVVGAYHDLEELCARLVRDEPFWRNSGGGVTLSGGEPTLYMEYVGSLLRRLQDAGAHTLLETCGHFDFERFSSVVLPHLDQIYFDVKLGDEGSHRKHTGRTNRVIRKNLRMLAGACRDRVLPRVPLVPGLTATRENLRTISALLREFGFEKARLLPYNPLWPDKAMSVGREPRMEACGWMDPGEVTACEEAFFEGALVPG